MSQLAINGAARVAAAFGGIVFSAAVGQLLGVSALGVVSLVQAIMFALALVAQLGIDRALVRYVARVESEGRSIAARRFLKVGLLRVIPLALVLAVCMFGARVFWDKVFVTKVPLDVLFWFSCSLLPFCVSHALSAVLKGYRQTALATFFEQGMIALYAAVYIILASEIGFDLSVELVAKCYFVGSVTAVLVSSILVVPKLLGVICPPVPSYVNKEFLASSVNYMWVALLVFGLNSGGLLVAGALLEADALGVFRAAERLCLLISFPLAVVNSLYPPRFAFLWNQGLKSDLKLRFVEARRVASVMAVPIFCVLVAFPFYFMELIVGEHELNFVLRYFAMGALVNACFGPVGNMLSMTGHERTSRNVAGMNTLIALPAYWLAMTNLGLEGAAMCYTLTSVLQGVMLFYWVKKLVFVDFEKAV